MVTQPEPQPEPQAVPVAQPEPEPVVQAQPATLQDRYDYTRDQTQMGEPDSGDLSSVGIDLNAYSDIPESLRREKDSHFSHLEFGDDVDLGNKRRQRK